MFVRFVLFFQENQSEFVCTEVCIKTFIASITLKSTGYPIFVPVKDVSLKKLFITKQVLNSKTLNCIFLILAYKVTLFKTD